MQDELAAVDPLGFPGYRQAHDRARASSEVDESVVAGPAQINGIAVELASFAFSFLGGSMGEVAGERVARALERAAGRGVPCVVVTASGGARVQEGMRALVQMPKVVSARLTLADARQPLLAVLLNPTMGGVFVTLGGLADVVVAQSGAMVGFAGPRLVQRFTRRPLAQDSHTAESALEHGIVDAVVAPGALRAFLGRALGVLRPDDPSAAPAARDGTPPDVLDAWDAVLRARDPERPTGAALVRALGDEALELHGDRSGSDDPGLHAAVVRVAGRRCAVLALDRDHTAGVAGCRKALRALELATRLRLPVVTLVDTGGLDPSEEAEAAGIGPWIGRVMQAMLCLPVASVAVVSGEGGSGGALAFACADEVLALSDSTFSVLGPEATAEILWREPARAPEAARALRLTAHDLVGMGIADQIVAGPPEADTLRSAVVAALDRLAAAGPETAERDARRRRWRHA